MAKRFKKRSSSPFATSHASMMTQATVPFLKNGKFKESFVVPLADLSPDPQQPRHIFDANCIKELAHSLESTGQLQPILVRQDDTNRDKWIIVAGERRFWAAHELGWDSINAVPFEGDAQLASLLENLIRVDLSPAEEAQAISKIVKAQNWTQREAEQKLGITQSNISRAMKAANLPHDFLKAAAEKRVPMSLLVLLAGEGASERCGALMQKALEGTLRAADFQKKVPQKAKKSGAKVETLFKRAEKVSKDFEKIKPTVTGVTEEQREKIQTIINRLSLWIS